MNSTLDNLLPELKTDKIQIRTKAFNRLFELLTSRLPEVQKTLNNSSQSGVSWEELFKATHDGVVNNSLRLLGSGSDINENDSKITNFTRVILKVVEGPDSESNGIPYNVIVKRVCDVLENEGLCPHLGNCYLQILRKSVLRPKNNLKPIKLESWKTLLACHFKLFKYKIPGLPFYDLIVSTQLIVELGCAFSHLAKHLPQYLERMSKILEKRKELTSREKQGLLVLSYHCCRNIAVDYRFDVCRYTEVIAKHIHDVFKDIRDDIKPIMFKLMDLAVIVHHPSLADGRKVLEYVHDKDEWRSQLRNFFYMVDQELKLQVKTGYRRNVKPEVDQAFAQFAARLCFLMYWDESIWERMEVDDEPSSSKRIKKSEKLQALLDLAMPSDEIFNWKWLTVIAELVHNYPAALGNDDFQPMLQLLAQFQPTIEYDVQVYTFTKCCLVLLQRENNFVINTIVANLCKELWHKIADGAARVCTLNNKTSVENHVLLQILLHHRKYPSNSFIEDVIKIFLTKSTVKCDVTLETLSMLMKSFNLDSLTNGKDLAIKILNYNFEKPSAADLKSVIATTGKGKPSAGVLSEVGVICCLSKTDVFKYHMQMKIDEKKIFNENWKLEEQNQYKKEVSSLIHLIYLRGNEKLLIEDENFMKSFEDTTLEENFPVELKCILEDQIYEELAKVTEFKRKLIDENTDVEQIKFYLAQVLEHNEIMMNLAHNFLKLESFNEEKFRTSFIVKNIDFHLQEIDRLFEQSITKKAELELNYTHQLLVLVKSLFDSKFHAKICKKVRSFDLQNCIRWVSRQVKHKFNSSKDRETMKIGKSEFEAAKMEEKIKFMAVEALCLYNNFEGADTQYIIDNLTRVEFDVHDNMDLHTIFHVVKIFAKQKTISKELVEWIWNGIIDICSEHNQNQYLSGKIVESFGDIVKITLESPSQTGNLVMAYHSYGKICANSEFNPETTVAFVRGFKFFHQHFFSHILSAEKVQLMYKILSTVFLTSDFFEIRMETIKTLSFVLHSDIESISELSQIRSLRQSKKEIFNSFFNNQQLRFDGNEMEVDGSNDSVIVKIASSLQLMTSLFCSNFVLRKSIIIEFAKIILLYKLNDTAIKIFEKILKYLKCNAASLMDSNSTVDLLSQWVNNGYHLDKFPFYFFGLKSIDTFFDLNYELVVLSLLKNMCNQVERFTDITELDTKSVIKDLLPKCFSFMLPIEAGCRGIKYETKAEALKVKIDNYFTRDEQKSLLLCNISTVIGGVLENVFDRTKFSEICGFELEVFETQEMINYESFDKCLHLLKGNYKIPGDQSILTYYCTQKNLLHFIEKLLISAKEKIQSTSLKEHKLFYLLQYCVLVEKLFPYLTEVVPSNPEHDIKAFIIREVTNFMNVLIVEEKFGLKLREVALRFLDVFLRKVLPSCADNVKPILSKIVLALVEVCGKVSSKFNQKCIEILEFLIIDQSRELEEEIANLDKFPDKNEFEAVKTKQLEVKYKNGEFSLVEEIEHFLKIEKRKVEGLTALRKQLSTKKSELKALFEETSATLGFTEDGESSLLHKLVRSLVDYSRSSADNEERSLEAVKCLGEIGCYDLSTMVFTSEDTSIYQRIEDMEDCQKSICAKVLDRMEKLLLHPNPLIFKPASSACYLMLESKSSQGYVTSPYLRPFRTNTINSKSIFYEEPKRNSKMNFVDTLRETFVTYKTWIKRISGSFLIFVGNKILEQVTAAQKMFAETMFPMLVQLLLIYNNPEINDELIAGLEFFFNEAGEKLNFPNANENSIFLNKEAIRQMLKMAECIRIHCQHHPKSSIAVKMSSDEMKQIYLNIAKAANHCEAFFTAVMYCELWAEKDRTRALSNKTLQDVLNKSLTAIGITDASELFINPFNQRSKYLQLVNLNFQNILEHDAVQSGDYTKLLSDIGLDFLTQKLSSKEKPNYECLWRLGNWDALLENDPEGKVVDHHHEFEKFHYAGLKCLKTGDELGVKISINKARKATLLLLQQESLECTENLYKFLAKSQLLQQIEDFAEFRFNNLQEIREKLLKKWKIQNQLPHTFKLIEPILTQRSAIFDTVNIRSGRRIWVPEALQSNMLLIVKEAIEAGSESEAIKTIAKMKTLEKLTTTNKAELLIKEAELMSKTEMNFAKHCLKQVLEDREFEKEFVLKSIAYRNYGALLAENHAEDLAVITNNYFDKSVKYLMTYAKHYKKEHLISDVTYSQNSQNSQNPDADDREDDVYRKIKENICVFDIIARYFDREYVAKSDYIKSPDFNDKISTYERNLQKVEDMKPLYKKGDESVKKSFIILSKSVTIDSEEIASTKKSHKKAAGNAMYYYLRSAINDDQDNVLGIFRIISIWLANLNYDVIFKMLNESLLNIPSYKFIKALPQLTVRLNEKSSSDRSNDLLMKLLTRCAVDHPHHTLPLILALVNSYADAPCAGEPEPRVVGAKNLWKTLKTTPGILPEMLRQMEQMSKALIDLANLEIEKKVPETHPVTQLKLLTYVQCPTVDIPIMKSCNYKSRVTSIVRWSKQIEHVGGVNAPKKIQCLCSDGFVKQQLLKGRDDMRQDAVMQQVFGVVNRLLQENVEMKNRHARIRTYKVVPFSRRSGILEWCNNALPIGSYLAGDRIKKTKGAHERYHPEDLKPHECMNKITAVDRHTSEQKIKAFNEICENFRPVFHQFFYENYSRPGQLFERRLLYTTSVAVSSMVGYILGIGDRHVQNILIDLNTAEVIHIDFGITFEQGRILPHPELIPFRLTRDMVAPMGVCGVDGVFRKTCEKTMEIMRQNAKTLTTIVEVLLYDPMFSWSLANKARRRQLDDENDSESSEDSNDVERDSMANRALLKIQSKLKGQADQSSGYSSVERQVESLIQSATNVGNLSKLYRGWQAYL